MATPLLTAKLYIPPPRPSLVARSRLLERLDEGLRLGHCLTLISAPAGFGKTTLVAEWIKERLEISDKRLVNGADEKSLIFNLQSLHFAWLSLDEGDNDPVRFLTYLVAALRKIDETIGQTVQSLLRAPPATAAVASPSSEAGSAAAAITEWTETLMTLLLNDLAATSRPFVLVLDDYHVIDQLAIHQIIGLLLERQPRHMHLVIATRRDPLLPISRLRARAQVTELRAADLRFTDGEAAAFLTETMGLTLTPDQVVALEARTEGWIAGLQLAALALQTALPAGGQADPATFIRAFSGSERHVMDYLVDEVLCRQPEAIQRFLLQTSILERLSGPLCDAVLGIQDQGSEIRESGITESGIGRTLSPDSLIPNSQSLLEYLEHSNLFLVPLDDHREWYRYHHLFAELLRYRLQQQVGGQGLADLHRRAAEWYEQRAASPEEYGWVDQAIHHWLAAEDYERAARLIERHHPAIVARGELATVHTWLQRLPEEILRHRPWVCIFYAWGLSWQGKLDKADLLLEAAAQHIQAGDLSPETLSMLGHIAYLRSRAAGMRGELTQAIQLALVARNHVSPQNLVARTSVEVLLGYVYFLNGDLTLAGEVLQSAAQLGQTAGALNGAVASLCVLAEVRRVQGELHAAAALYRQAMQFIEERDSQHLGAIGLVNIGLARLLYEWNDLEAANARIRQSVDYMRWWDKPDDRAVACITLANVSCALGDIRGAEDTLWRARQIVDTQHVFPDTSQAVETAQVKWWLSRGDLASAAGWAERRQLHESDPLAFRDELEWMALARVRIAQALDDPHSPALEEARRWLARLAEAACAARRTGHLIEILALQALALNAQHSIAQAVTVLQQSLILAEPEGYVRVFVDEGTRMADLLARAAERGIAPEYARKLLAAFSDEGRTTKDEGPLRATEDERPSPMSSVARSGPSSSVESLTERELEVLGLVAAGASNRAIAEALVVSVGTVKTHISRIMSKLGAGNRTEAVARARQLGIL